MLKSFQQEPLAFEVDGYRVFGVLHLPRGENLPVVIGSHGLFSNGSSPKQIELADRCNASGLAYLRLDHRGCGNSTGDFETATSLAGRCRDLAAAAKKLRSRPELGRSIGLFGSSLGGAVCLAAAGEIRPERIVTIAAPIDSRSIVEQTRRPGGPTVVPDVFRKPALQFDLRDRLHDIRHLLIFHGDRDETIPVSHGKELYERVSEPKKLIINADGDHRMSRRDHQLRFLEEAVQWLTA